MGIHEGVIEKVQDLVETLTISNINWNEWEQDFIESLSSKLETQFDFKLTPKQYEKVNTLWEKI